MTNRDLPPNFQTHPAHPSPVSRHNAPTVLHLTVCTRDRGDVLNHDLAHAALVAAWRQATHWHVGEYMVMPDHVHLFCVPGLVDHAPVRRWVGFWKRLAGKECAALKSIFQEDCWDTQMRERVQYDEKLSYVRHNPERKGLVAHWEQWPYRGRVFDVGWS